MKKKYIAWLMAAAMTLTGNSASMVMTYAQTENAASTQIIKLFKNTPTTKRGVRSHSELKKRVLKHPLTKTRQAYSPVT